MRVPAVTQTYEKGSGKRTRTLLSRRVCEQLVGAADKSETFVCVKKGSVRIALAGQTESESAQQEEEAARKL